MKKTLFLLLAVLFSMAAQLKADDIPFRQQRREMFSICPTDPQTVVFLGNSITNFGVWPEVFANEGYKVVNRGISGNFSDEVMQHIRLIADGQPKAIYLMIGINDFGTPDIIVPSIRKTIQIVREVSPNTDIYVQSILPCAYNPRQTTPTTQNPLIKAMIKSDFADDSKVHYADIFDALSDNGSSPKSGVLDDNLHPNVNGYRDWTKKLHAGGYIDVAPKYSDEAWSNAGNVHYYDNRILGQYNKLPLSADDILIMGDQTVQGGEWAELMQNQNVKNRGIGIGTGQLTTYVSKFKTEIPYILHGSVMPSKIAVQVGQGDLILNGTEAATVWTTYEQCIDLIHEKAPSTQIYLNTVIPVVSGDPKAANNAKVTAFNDMIRSYAATKDYCTLVDIADVIDDAEGYLAAEFEGANSKQSKVPNARAYLEWAKLLSQTMGLSTTPRATLTAKQYELLLKIDDTYASAYAQTVGTQLGNVSSEAFSQLQKAVDAAKALTGSTDDTAIDAQISNLTTALSTMSSTVVLTPATKDAQGRNQYYRLKCLRDSRYVTAEKDNSNILGTTAVADGSYWKFVARKDGNYDLVNYLTDTYISADGVSSGNALQSVISSPSKGWRIDTSNSNGYLTIVGDGLEFNQQNNGNYYVLNWGGGTNKDDQGCKYVVETIAFEDLPYKEPEKEVEGEVRYELNLNHENLGHLMPQPRSVNLTGTDLNLAGAIHIIYNRALTEDESYLQNVVNRFLAETGCTEGEGIHLQINFVNSIKGTTDYRVADFDNEAYALKVDGNTITVSAIKPIGVIRAMQTLTMMAQENSKLPGCEIVDWPAFKVRGLMHDIGRSYISVDELKQEIDLLTRFKENVFLWHLTDKHGFRFESKSHPNVNTNFSPTRSQKYYTQDECTELMNYARERGMTIIPEIDMPGHSARFQGATGVTMASEAGKVILKDILKEVAQVFPHSPYIHIGGDETSEATMEYMNEMGAYVRSLGRKVVLWNRYSSPAKLVTPSTMKVDMTTNWATSGTLVSGLPNIDMRYNYINHFDMYADLAGIYRSSIFGVQQGNKDVAGSITGLWNDRLIPEEELIVRENNLYANALATAERGWKGGGRHYYDEAEGGAYLPNSGADYDEFKDWETRFLFHKNTTLSAAKSKIPYVKQTNVRWNITHSYDNGGDQTKVFAPETAEQLTPEAGDITATGAGIWLNHIWAGTVAGVLGKAGQPTGQTRYAWTYVYSPKAQTVGAQVETYNYSRSQMGAAPANGTWDNRGSRIWVNEKELKPNVSKWTTAGSGEETNLGNINFTARPLMQIQLKEGWNKVLLKLPNTKANIGNYGGKWQFTFVFTDTEGNDAVEGLIYSPTQCIDEEAEALSAVIQDVRNYIAQTCNDKVGCYPASMAASLTEKADAMNTTLGDVTITAEQREEQKGELRAGLDALKAQVAAAGTDQIVRPTSGVTYTLRDKRGNKYTTSAGAGKEMTGTTASSAQAMWTFIERADGTFDLQNFTDGSYIAPISGYNKSLSTTAEAPANGWKVTPASVGSFILTTMLGSQRNQLHQTTGTAVYNWGWESGSSPKTSDNGCLFTIEEADMSAYEYLKYFNTEEDLAAGNLSWVGFRNVRNNGYTAFVSGTTATTVGSHQNGSMADTDQFALVGTPESFYIYSKTYGTAASRALGYTSTSEATAVVPGRKSLFCLTESTTARGTFYISPKSQPDQSWNMYGGAGQPIKFYRSSDAGSNWTIDLISLAEKDPTVIQQPKAPSILPRKYLQHRRVAISKEGKEYDASGRRIK